MVLPLTSDEIRHIADESAEAALRKLLVAMGVDANDPKALIEMQKDFAHIRGWRESVETVKRQGLKVAVATLVSGLLGAVWLMIGKH